MGQKFMTAQEFVQIITAISQMTAHQFGNLKPIGPYIDAIGVSRIIHSHLDVQDQQKFKYEEDTKTWVYYP